MILPNRRDFAAVVEAADESTKVYPGILKNSPQCPLCLVILYSTRQLMLFVRLWSNIHRKASQRLNIQVSVFYRNHQKVSLQGMQAGVRVSPAKQVEVRSFS